MRKYTTRSNLNERDKLRRFIYTYITKYNITSRGG